MKVIEHGKLYGSIIKVKCLDCDCVFLANAHDYREWKIGNNLIYFVECPECGNKFLIDDDESLKVK